jgi:hypothetical protein
MEGERAMKILAAMFQLALFAALPGSAAWAIDVDFNVEIGPHRPPRVVVPAAPVVERVWVTEKVVRRTERMLIEPAHIEKRTERVCVHPAQIVTRNERVMVEPARIERVKETVLVQPERVGRVWVPPVTEEVKIGPVRFTRTLQEGYWREAPIAAEYKTVYRDVEVPPKYATVSRDIEVPARYETVYKEVEVPARYRDVTRDEVLPAHWEERVIAAPPPVFIGPPPRPGIEFDIDLHKRKRD